MVELVLPNLGFSMEEGRILAWLKAPGDAIHKGEPVAEIEGDKATVELEATVNGVLAEIIVPTGQVAAVGAVLAHIRPDSAMSEPERQPNTRNAGTDEPRISPVAQRLAREKGVELTAIIGTGPGGRITRQDIEAGVAEQTLGSPVRVLAAPAVRKFARDHSIDLSMVQGTGKEGRRTRGDVEAFLEARVTSTDLSPRLEDSETWPASATPAEGRHAVPSSPSRQVISRKLAASAREAPHFFTTAQLDLTDALDHLPDGVGLNALILYMTVRALKAVPALNATFENETLYHYDHVNLSLAVALPDSLLSPVLHHADDFSLTGLASRAKDLISRARAGKLRTDEMSGGTFTVSNLGMVEQVERFTAILNPPQVGILAVGAAKDRPLAINRGLHIRKTVYVTLSADHRAVDGMVAARFIEQFDRQLQAFSRSDLLASERT